MDYTIDDVLPEHLPRLAEILNYYVEHTTVTFHTTAVSVEDMASKVFFDQPYHKSFVIMEDGNVIGYCAVSQWKKQEAYRHTAEINIYLDHTHTGKNIGSMAIKHLEHFAMQNGINTLIAGLCSENMASKTLFEKNGYEHCATFKKVGVKFGRVLDVVYFQKALTV